MKRLYGIILLTALAPDGGAAAQAAPETTEQKIARLEAENAALRSSQAQQSEDEGIIREKMALGLSREQAIAVIAEQRATDGYIAEANQQRADAAKAQAKGGRR